MSADMLAACEQRQLTAWERAFLADIRRRHRPLTPKQRALLERIVEGPPDFPVINAAACRRLPDLLARWLPDGAAAGHEYSARNPRRADRHPAASR